MKVKDIKPGMVVNFLGANGQDNYELVTSINNGGDIAITHLSFQDSYGGKMIRYEDRNSDVYELATGEKRKYIIEKILKDLHDNLHDVENDIDIVRLIQSMGE